MASTKALKKKKITFEKEKEDKVALKKSRRQRQMKRKNRKIEDNY
jgi:hypothetical protein